MNMLKFCLDGCDISFFAQAPEDITLKQLLQQCDRIIPDYCACGIVSENFDDKYTDLIITYDNITKAKEYVSCTIKTCDNCLFFQQTMFNESPCKNCDMYNEWQSSDKDELEH